MIELPFSCYRSEIKINPRNWQTNKSTIIQDWFLYYRFYDPSQKHIPKYSKGKLVVIKGMNCFHDYRERVSKTKILIDDELARLKDGFNPIISNNHNSNSPVTGITDKTPFLKALVSAEKRLGGSSSTKRDLNSIIGQVSNAAEQLSYQNIPISLISRKHIKEILLNINTTMGDSPHRFNKIRSYLMIIYKELQELEAVETNPLKDIAKKKTIQRLRNLPSNENRISISEHLKENHYRFWLFMQIFFHSGARLTELMLVQKQHVDIDNQSFIIIVKKGNSYKEVQRPIKTIALPYWISAMSECKELDFIFSKGLYPGPTSIQSYQITKRWNLHVKKKLGIEDDFYSLKHLNLDETAAILGIDDSAAMASHSSTAITIKHYATNEIKRQAERLKGVGNEFTPL